MKKTLNRSLLKKALDSKPSEHEAPGNSETSEETEAQQTVRKGASVGGAGSAWKAGAAEQNRAALVENRRKIADDIMAGKYVLEIETSRVFDRIGTDRRDDWQDQSAFDELRESIKGNGQDTPIRVWPTDPNWQPDRLEPSNIEGVDFDLVTGRRRHAIAASLGRKVLAIIAPPTNRGDVEEQFSKLFMRFRENEERENLGPFERLCAIGEMFEELLANHTGSAPTAVSFAQRINVHESIVSRGRAVYRDREAILNKFKNAYELSYPDLQKAVSSLKDGKATAKKSVAKPKKINVTKKVGSRKLSLSSQDGKLSVSTSGLKLTKDDLDGLGDIIADHLNKIRSK